MERNRPKLNTLELTLLLGIHHRQAGKPGPSSGPAGRGGEGALIQHCQGHLPLKLAWLYIAAMRLISCWFWARQQGTAAQSTSAISAAAHRACRGGRVMYGYLHLPVDPPGLLLRLA